MLRNPARVTGALGIAATVALIAGAIVLGSMPAADDSADEVLAFTVDHRGRLLIAMWLLGMGMAVTLAFVVGLCVLLREREASRDLWTSIALASAAAVFALALVGLAVVAAAAYRGDQLGTDTARSLWDLYLATVNASNIMTVLLSVALALSMLSSRALPRFTAWASFVVAAAHLVASAAWARDGAFSPTGAFGQAAGFVFLVWMLAVAVVLVRGTVGGAAVPVEGASAATQPAGGP